MASTKKTAVLYLDHAGHPAPLSLSYHATASRLLSSSISDRRPPSTTTEVDSAYCPQCLSSHIVSDASGPLKGVCPKASCRACPVCSGVLSLSLEPCTAADDDDGGGTRGDGDELMVCMYTCGYCRWTSEECGVTAKVKNISGKNKKEDAEAIAVATDTLLYEIEKRVEESSGSGGKGVVDGAFKNLVEKWGKKEQEEERRRKQGGAIIQTTKRRSRGETKLWSIETLENAIKTKKEKIASGDASAMMNISRLNLDSDDEEDDSPFLKEDRGYLTSEQIANHSAVVSNDGGEVLLLPVPIQLRPRKSRRCRAEVAAGRAGILVKPKLNPLEGDSSNRSGHGQWYKKDSSAIHVVPRVQVVKHGSLPGKDEAAPTQHALLLMVKNPTLGTIKLRLNGTQSDAVGQTPIDPSELQNVLIDPIKQTRVDADICSSASALKPTEVMELEAVDDVFLELGKGQSKDPPEVERWDASTVLSSERGGAVLASAKVVATQNDKAWVDLVVSGEAPSSDNDMERFLAAPIALQIEVGEGSWETSLIKPQPVAEGEHDLVTLKLVILWSGQR